LSVLTGGERAVLTGTPPLGARWRAQMAACRCTGDIRRLMGGRASTLRSARRQRADAGAPTRAPSVPPPTIRVRTRSSRRDWAIERNPRRERARSLPCMLAGTLHYRRIGFLIGWFSPELSSFPRAPAGSSPPSIPPNRACIVTSGSLLLSVRFGALRGAPEAVDGGAHTCSPAVTRRLHFGHRRERQRSGGPLPAGETRPIDATGGLL